jgi:hypothetical protein
MVAYLGSIRRATRRIDSCIKSKAPGLDRFEAPFA